MTKRYELLLTTIQSICNMKRIAIVLAILCSCIICHNAHAQLNITAAVEQKPERLLTGHIAYSYLYKTSSGNYEYWANTDNQFDTNYTTLFLGDSPESAILTLKDLKSLMEKEVAGVSVQQEGGNVFLVYQKQLGTKMLWIKQDGRAGKSWISLQLVEKFISYFEGSGSIANEQMVEEDDENKYK